MSEAKKYECYGWIKPERKADHDLHVSEKIFIINKVRELAGKLDKANARLRRYQQAEERQRQWDLRIIDEAADYLPYEEDDR